VAASSAARSATSEASIQALPRAAELPAEISSELAASLQTLDTSSLWWLSGYAAGLARGRSGSAAVVQPTVAAVSQARAVVIHASQTGNARRAAEALAAALQADGHAVDQRSTAQLKPADLVGWQLLLFVISTQGDGDPPEDALDFIEALTGRRAPPLRQQQFAVLALGDSSYPQFCATGRLVDRRLAELGAQRLLPIAEADVDVQAVATPWIERGRQAVRELLGEPAARAPVASVTPLHRAPAAVVVDRDRPASVEVIANQPISDRRATRRVHHVELDLAGSGLGYEPGDAIGVWPRNPAATVDAVLAALALDGDRRVTHEQRELPLREWLTREREITRLHRDVIAAQAARLDDAALGALLLDGQALRGYVEQHQFIDLAAAGRGAWDADSLVATLKPLAPRLYSIASSQAEVGDEVHLTIAAIDEHGRPGAASSTLLDAVDGERLPIYLAANPGFRLPADDARDIIMIGAGTGVAPFRAFMQQRIATGARGRNWLLFGNRRFREDFLYQTEWQAQLAAGQLQKLSLAFSRDGGERVYVQQRLCEQADELRAYLADGAHLYVCGSLALGRDVHAALREILSVEHAGDEEAAEEALRELRQQGRYSRDLY